MKDARRAMFIALFGHLFPVSDTMIVKCWRAVRTKLPDDDLDGLIAGLREAVIARAHAVLPAERNSPGGAS